MGPQPISESIKPGVAEARVREGLGYPLPPWLSGIKLPDISIRLSSQVYRLLAYYRTDPVGRSVLAHWLGRMKRFESLIRAELRRHGLPQALVYVAMIESGFRPTTVSHAGAAGLWQFMAHGGSIYGLSRSFWVDERFNPDRSTRAAMYYFKDLHRRFGNWEMALAAYNAGYGAMTRAVSKYNTNDYWRLCDYEAGMPYETMTYVPKFYAIAIVAQNLSRFELEPRGTATPWEYGLASAPGGTPLANVAKMAGVPLAAVRELNPELLRNRLPPGQPYELRLPPAALPIYRRAAAQREAGQRSLVTYRVRQGDTLASIAKDHRVSEDLIKRINDIRSHREIRPRVVLLLPAPGRQGRPAVSKELRIVALPDVPPPTPDHRAVYYPVVEGDQLDGVARALGVTPVDLLLWNALTADTRLLPGLVLRAYLPGDQVVTGVRLLAPDTLRVVTVNSSEFHELHLGRQNRRRVVIRAKEGDTMQRIATRYGVTRGSLARTNKLSTGALLRPGQPLVIYTKAPQKRGGRR